MASFFRRFPWVGRPWKPLPFSNATSRSIPRDQRIEEELLPGYVASRYYPVRIGEVLRDRYQVVGKLGFGASSTVWLARDMEARRYVASKMFIDSESLGKQLDHEMSIYNRISQAPTSSHPGRGAIRQLLDSFDVSGPTGSHRCLVHPPLGESMMTFLHRNPVMRLPPVVLAMVLRRLFQALDYLHAECKVIHTDIKGDNILMGISDDTVFTTFEEQELTDPSPRKIVDDGERTIYESGQLPMLKGWGPPVLCDFGSAVPGDVEHVEDVQPDIYRAPEVILQASWGCEIDIWNAGCMVWDLFEGGHLFTGYDEEHRAYRSRAHLAEMIALLGDPPKSLLERGKSSHKWFTENGAPSFFVSFPPSLRITPIPAPPPLTTMHPTAFAGNLREGIKIPNAVPLEARESSLEGESRELFLRMMGRMLRWEPEKRASAGELAEDEWIMQFFNRR